jgi:hypothetical protein
VAGKWSKKVRSGWPICFGMKRRGADARADAHADADADAERAWPQTLDDDNAATTRRQRDVRNTQHNALDPALSTQWRGSPPPATSQGASFRTVTEAQAECRMQNAERRSEEAESEQKKKSKRRGPVASGWQWVASGQRVGSEWAASGQRVGGPILLHPTTFVRNQR